MECGNRLLGIPLCNLRPLPSAFRAAGLEDQDGIIYLDTGSSSKSVDSNVSVRQVADRELIFDAESSVRSLMSRRKKYRMW